MGHVSSAPCYYRGVDLTLPGKHPHDYIKAVLDREIRWLEAFADDHPHGRQGPFETSPIQNDPGVHITLLKKLALALPYLCMPGMMNGHLHHEDIYYGNLFVEGNKITSVIDWQASWVGPLQLQARNPPMLDVPKVQRVEIPDDFAEYSLQDRAGIKLEVEKTLLLRTYSYQMEKEIPSFHRAMKLDKSKLLTKGLLFANDTWEGGVLPLRGTLVKMEE